MDHNRGFHAKLCASLSLIAAATFTSVALAQKAVKPAVTTRPSVPKENLQVSGANKIDAALASTNPVVPSPLYDLVAYARVEGVPVPPKLPGQNIPLGTESMCKGSPGYKNPQGVSSSGVVTGGASTGSNQTAGSATTNQASSSASTSTSSSTATQTTAIAPVACEGWVPVPGTKPAASSGSGDWIGRKGVGRGIEAFSVTPRLLAQGGKAWPSCLQLEYMAHVPGRGDTGWYSAPTLVGTPGSGQFVEGIAFRLAGSCAASYSVKYNCHLNGLGDQTKMSGPDYCGTRGQGRAVESFVVYVNGRDASAAPAGSMPGKSTVTFVLNDSASSVGPDEWLGTKGRGIQLPALAVIPTSIASAPPWPACLQVKYMAHVSGLGDTGWYDAPSYIKGGLEGVAFKLDGACAADYAVEYQCHVQGLGDRPLTTGPAFCGTRGQGRRLEAVKLTVRRK